MTSSELRATLALASMYSFRMLGLFMLLPLLGAQGLSLTYANPKLIGLALGIYGLTQACLQIPFAISSDKFGRKPLIFLGLILFALGSVLGAVSTSIYGVILARAIQGSGAIGSVLMALLTDVVEDQHQLKAMTLIGMTIGISFLIAIVLGPALCGWFGISGIFWITALLSVVAMLLLGCCVPTPHSQKNHQDSSTLGRDLLKTISSPELLSLDLGILFLHAILTALFLVIPSMLHTQLEILPAHQWHFYAPVLLMAALIMFPFVAIAESKRILKPLFLGAIFLLTTTELFLMLAPKTLLLISLTLCLFFAAFTFLEACLPSLIAKIAPQSGKGTAMGIYSTAQFLGIFLGGSLGGITLAHFGTSGVFTLCTALGALWFALAFQMKDPPYLGQKTLQLSPQQGGIDLALTESKLRLIPGVKTVMIDPQKLEAYLKVDRKIYKESAEHWLTDSPS